MLLPRMLLRVMLLLLRSRRLVAERPVGIPCMAFLDPILRLAAPAGHDKGASLAPNVVLGLTSPPRAIAVRPREPPRASLSFVSCTRATKLTCWLVSNFFGTHRLHQHPPNHPTRGTVRGKGGQMLCSLPLSGLRWRRLRFSLRLPRGILGTPWSGIAGGRRRSSHGKGGQMLCSLPLSGLRWRRLRFCHQLPRRRMVGGHRPLGHQRLRLGFTRSQGGHRNCSLPVISLRWRRLNWNWWPFPLWQRSLHRLGVGTPLRAGTERTRTLLFPTSPEQQCRWRLTLHWRLRLPRRCPRRRRSLCLSISYTILNI